MNEQSKFPFALKISMLIVTVMYLLTAVMSYSAWGDNVISPILLNLPQGPASSVATALITIHVMAAIPIFLTTLSLEIERKYKFELSSNEWIYRAVLRIVIVLFITLFAFVIPFFADFMTLLGAITNTVINLHESTTLKLIN
jgi:amino acid permease